MATIMKLSDNTFQATEDLSKQSISDFLMALNSRQAQVSTNNAENNTFNGKRVIDEMQATLPNDIQPYATAFKKRKVDACQDLSQSENPCGWWKYGKIEKDMIPAISNISPVQVESIPQQSFSQSNYPKNQQANLQTSDRDPNMVPKTQFASMPTQFVCLPNNSVAMSTNTQSLQDNRSTFRSLPPFSRQSMYNTLTAMQPTPSLIPDRGILEFSETMKVKNKPHQLPQQAEFQQYPEQEDEDNHSIDGSEASGENQLKFRAYQAENWTEKFEELLQFRARNGHCLVPNSFAANPPLAQWVKRQRYQYKLKSDNRRSTMSDERVQALNQIGFVWDSHSAIWNERLHELLEYRAMYGDCNVPSRYQKNRQLAVWVKRQRRQYKFYQEDSPSSMTPERIIRLEAIGFEWDLRKRSPSHDE